MFTIQEFVKDFHDKKIQNTKLNERAVEEYLTKTLEVKSYLPFTTKRTIAEMIARNTIDEIDGVKKHDSISSYLSFIVAMIQSHTNLQFSDNPTEDYDLLAESGLLPLIIDTFREDYIECDVLLKMAIAYELEDNNVNAIIGKFLNGLLERLDEFGDAIKESMGGKTMEEIIGANFKQEDLAKLTSLLNKLNK